jgi:trimeric autotransporter adhesin
MLDEWEFSGRRRLLLKPNPDGSQHADAAVALKLAPTAAVNGKHSNDCKHHDSSSSNSSGGSGAVCADSSDGVLAADSAAGAVQTHPNAAINNSARRRQRSTDTSDDTACNGDVIAEPFADAAATAGAVDGTACSNHDLVHEHSEGAVRSLDFTAASAQFNTLSGSEQHTMSVLDTESSNGHSRNSSSSSLTSSSSTTSSNRSSSCSETTAAVAGDSGGSSIPHNSTYSSSSAVQQHRDSVRSSCNSGGDSVDSAGAAAGGSGARSSSSASSSSSERTKHNGFVSMESAQKLWAGLRLHSAVAAAENEADAQVTIASDVFIVCKY